MKNMFKSRKLDLIGILVLFTAVLLMFNFASCKTEIESTTTYYTVTFDADGGSEVSSQKIESGKKATSPDSTKTGYYLSGWYNGETVFDFRTPITSDLTLRAKWTAYKYTIVFDKNGGTGDDMQSLSCTYDKDVALTMNSYTAPAGKVFVGWALSKDAATPVYSNGETIKNLTSKNGAVITLYAIYDTGYSVFYADGLTYEDITVPADSTKYSAGSTVTVLFDGIGKRLGYNFVGWSDGENTYTSGGTTTFQMGKSNVTLTALWETNIKVSFSDDSINLLPLKSATIDVTVTNPDSLSLTFSVSSSSYSNVSASWDPTNKQITLTNNLPYLFADKITITFENTTYGISKTLNVTSLVSDSDIDGTLTVNSAESTALSDWTQLTYSTEKKVYIYKLNCSKANVAYRILNADSVFAIRSAMQSAGITVIDSKYHLFDSSSNEIAGIDDGDLSVTPEKSCTYYLVVYPYRYGNSNPTQYVGSTAIYTYSVSAITSLLLSKNAVTLDAGGYIDIPVTYAGPEGYKTPSFVVTASGSNSTGSEPTSYSSGTMTDNGNGTRTLKIRAMNPGGSNTITLKDSVSALTATCAVTVNLNTSSIDAIINIGSGTSTTLSDYTQGTFTNEKGSFVYSLALTSGKNYFFESSDSNTSILPSNVDSVFILYDADGAYLKAWDDLLTYVPERNGTYYLVCRPYNASSKGNFAVHVYETKPITGLAFSQNTLSVNSGTTATLTATYTVPAGASPVFKVSSSADHGESYRASASFTQNGSGSETITVYGALPGTATITLTDSVSLLSIQCTVTVSIDDSSATDISSSSIGNAASTTQSDWTQVALTSAGQASVYKISLEANKKYTFEIADSGCNPGMMVNGTKVDAMFSLYDSSSTVISQLDGSSSDDKITVTPQSNVSYYFIVSPYDPGRTGAAAFHVYVSE
ncbi:InlB B-repeat-containing protein [Treponema sp. Marseille-Q3903]|uniref:InlB B-repeat-containing protein n=1 Tax=Treponema sp. Marseille-Q3903 TaxID=2766703 RepID=UPI00165217A0|nr:InlB B-repeat-containing protein [Treponema sp. Marseille-Q3903]MBC6713363.1 InlB B-repeat-containing protein [Treponema sp. Marseille-Q3903]